MTTHVSFDRLSLLAELKKISEESFRTFQIPAGFNSGSRTIKLLHEKEQQVLTSQLALHPLVKLRAGSMLNLGAGARAFSAQDMAQMLALRCLEVSGEKSLLELEEFLNAEKVRLRRCVVIFGPWVSVPTEIYDGVELWPLLHSLGLSSTRVVALLASGIALENFQSSLWTQETLPFQASTGVLVSETEFTKFTSDVEKLSTLPLENTTSNIIQRMLPLVCQGGCSWVAEWYEPISGEPFSGLYLGGYSYRTNPIGLFHEATQLDEQMVLRIRNLSKAYSTLPNDEKELLTVPFDRLNQTQQEASNLEKAIDLGICLESLLLRDREPSDTLALQFRLRGALFMGDSLAEREHHWKLLNDVYSLRSIAVHEGKLPVRNDHKAVIEQGISFAQDAIEKVILKGRPKDGTAWRKVLLQGSSNPKEPI